MSAMKQYLYFEDFEAGQRYDLGSIAVSEDAIIEFASEFDPQPFHLDPKAGSDSMLGGLAASGWHTACLGMKLLYDGLIGHSSCQGSPGINTLSWKRPVMPGDTLTGTAEILATRPLQSRDEMGLVTLLVSLANQDKALVATYENPVMFLKRKAGA